MALFGKRKAPPASPQTIYVATPVNPPPATTNNLFFQADRNEGTPGAGGTSSAYPDFVQPSPGTLNTSITPVPNVSPTTKVPSRRASADTYN